MRPVSEIRGRRWPTCKDGRLLEITAIEQTCSLIVHLPGGRKIRLNSKTTTLEQEKGALTQVSLLPLQETVGFPQAAAHVKRIASDLKADTDPRLRSTLEKWQNQDPKPDVFATETYMTKTTLEKGVLLYLEIKPHRERGWYIVVDITRPAQGHDD